MIFSPTFIFLHFSSKPDLRLEHLLHRHRVTYLTGTIMNVNDLRRVKVSITHSSTSLLLLNNILLYDFVHELGSWAKQQQMDVIIIFWPHSTQRITPYYIPIPMTFLARVSRWSQIDRRVDGGARCSPVVDNEPQRWLDLMTRLPYVDDMLVPQHCCRRQEKVVSRIGQNSTYGFFPADGRLAPSARFGPFQLMIRCPACLQGNPPSSRIEPAQNTDTTEPCAYESHIACFLAADLVAVRFWVEFRHIFCLISSSNSSRNYSKDVYIHILFECLLWGIAFIRFS